MFSNSVFPYSDLNVQFLISEILSVTVLLLVVFLSPQYSMAHSSKKMRECRLTLEQKSAIL